MRSTPKIKICGLRTIEDIHSVNKYDVDYVGFVFADSKRKVTQEEALYLRKHLKKNIKVVGVFVNESPSTIRDIVNYCDLDIVQLHGNQDNNECKLYNRPVWKSISVKNESSLEKISEFHKNIGLLLDTWVEGASGGTGKIFNWNSVRDLHKNRFVILAGGLNPENVMEAIHVVSPHVVDVSSGVEGKFGKDEFKIKEFVRRVRSNDLE